jgi:osmoprotectant transport system permease protein
LFTTDAEVGYYRLKVLEDDLAIFPKYNAVYIYRKDALKKFPALTAALKELEGRISDSKMVELNGAVKMEKFPEATVADSFLSGKRRAKPNSGWLANRFWSDTRNHLQLVVFPLVLDILVAVPLGVVAARQPRLGEFILGICGVVQTIPSLALLVFMVPLLGIGYWPALVALFLYGLLPILRNTYTGLRDIPQSLLESADALGLPSHVRLLRVEIPLASRAILAGIKTSAVINVGTATIGAIIGAGGYGEPIMIGVRRDDTSLLLQGAVPAALMAILIQVLFEMVERLLVPRGLQVQGRR